MIQLKIIALLGRLRIEGVYNNNMALYDNSNVVWLRIYFYAIVSSSFTEQRNRVEKVGRGSCQLRDVAC